MRHCFIAPINYLHLIPKESSLHLILAHLLENKQYVEFYKQRQAAGDMIILDNSTFEFKRPILEDEIFRLCEKANIQPDVIVAPDFVYRKGAETITATESFCRNYGKYFDKKKTAVMSVPQSEINDYVDWIHTYEHFLSMKEISWIGMSILGIPNAFQSLTGTKDISYNRIYATTCILNLQKIGYINIDSNKKHHYLGLGDSVRELQIQKQLGLAYSNDSSSAFWRAIAHQEYPLDRRFNNIANPRYDFTATGQEQGKCRKVVDFNIPFNELAVEDIKYNIDFIEQLLSK